MVRLAFFAACLALAACSPPAKPAAAPAPYKAAMPVKELMRRIVDPSADDYWLASGTIIDKNGEHDRSPTTDAGWTQAVDNAAKVAESGNLLLVPGRALNEPEWTKYSQDLIEAGSAAMKAAQARDKKAVFDTGGQIYSVCLECHRKYILGE